MAYEYHKAAVPNLGYARTLRGTPDIFTYEIVSLFSHFFTITHLKIHKFEKIICDEFQIKTAKK